MLLSFSMYSELHSSKRSKNASNSASRVKAPDVFRPTFLPAKIWLSLAQRVEIESTIIERNRWTFQSYKIPSLIERNPSAKLRKLDNKPVETDEERRGNRLHSVAWTCELSSGNQQSVIWLVGLTNSSNMIGWFHKRSELRNVFVQFVYKNQENVFFICTLHY